MRVRKTMCAALLAGGLALGGAAGAATAQAQSGTAGPDGEVVTLLQELIRLNTSNPPGNEGQVAELLRARLAPLGFEVEVLPTPTPGKAHLIARLRAEKPTEKPLLLAGHSDVVGVERELWNVDPFAGLVRGGDVIGRGAMDFKGGLAAFTVAAMRLARSAPKATLKRDLILLSEADEEGGDYGTSWIAKNFWSKIDAGISLNEGGWILEDRRGTPRVLGITTVDKNSLSVTLRTRGTSTHSSRPLPDSAIDRLTRALGRIGRYETTPPALDPTARRYLRTWVRGYPGRSADALAEYLAAEGPAERRRAARPLVRGEYGELFNGLIRTIYVPTIVGGGFRSNVLPGTAEATVNIRLLPGAGPRPAIAELRRVIDDAQVRVAPIGQKGESVNDVLERFEDRARQRPSRTGTELYRSLVSEGRAEWPTARPTPALFEAGTDATPWRQRGIPVYGIYPYPVSRAELSAMHGNGERISVKRLEEGTDWVSRVLRDVVVH